MADPKIKICARCREIKPMVNNSYCRACRNAYVRDQRRAEYGPRERRLAKERYREDPGLQIDRVIERREGPSSFTPEQRDAANLVTKRRQRRDPVAFYSKQMYANAKKRSAAIGVGFDLDVEWIAEKLRTGRCEVTSMPFDMMPKTDGRKGHNPMTPSLDRKIAGGDYTKVNVQVVVFVYNLSKSNWGHAAVAEMAASLAFVPRGT